MVWDKLPVAFAPKVWYSRFATPYTEIRFHMLTEQQLIQASKDSMSVEEQAFFEELQDLFDSLEGSCEDDTHYPKGWSKERYEAVTQLLSIALGLKS